MVAVNTRDWNEVKPGVERNVCAAEYASKVRRAFTRKFGPEQFVSRNWRKTRSAILTHIKGLPKAQRQKQLKAVEERRMRVVGEFQYQARSWNKERRIIAVCDYFDRGLERRFIITNLPDSFPEVIHKQYYCKRGRAEQFIKQSANEDTSFRRRLGESAHDRCSKRVFAGPKPNITSLVVVKPGWALQIAPLYYMDK